MARSAKDTLPLKQSDDILTVIGNSFKLIRKSWEALQLNLLTFVCIYAIPFLLVFGFLTLSGLSHLSAKELSKIDFTPTFIITTVIVIVSFMIISVYISIASIIAQLASIRGKTISFRESINEAQPFFWRFILLSIISGLIVLGGLILLIIPGIILFVLLVLAGYFMVDRNLSAIEAIKACYKASRAHWKLPVALITVQAVIQFPSVVPGIGGFIATIFSILYFCLPAIVYTRMQKALHTRTEKKA